MKKSLACLLLILFLPVLISAAYAQVLISDASTLDTAALDEVVTSQMAKHGLPGVALEVIENGQVIYQKGYGVDGNDQPMTPQTQCFIGSQSKSFTALAIAQLAEQGKLDLDQPVQTYIPWFRVADEKASARITINHLLHHTSGLSDSGYGIVLPLDTLPEEAVRSLAKAQLTASVGTKFQYFNMGYAVLSYLIELQSGQSYAEYIQTHVLSPLGMQSSTADPALAKDMPKGYTRLFGFAIPAREGYPLYGVGEGWIVSTAENMAKYAVAFQNNASQLVSDAMLRRILTPGIGSYGMGWFIYDAGAKIMHGGANQTFRTEVNLYPKSKRAFVLLTNQGHQLDHFVSANQLTNNVEDVVLGRSPEPLSEGWSVRWVGWAIGALVLGLCFLHTHNFLALRTWKERVAKLSPGKRAFDIIISFIIPVIITSVIFWQVSQFYGNRFNLISSIAYMRQGMPDIFILMLVGTLPDLTQGIIKLILWNCKGVEPTLRAKA